MSTTRYQYPTDAYDPGSIISDEDNAYDGDTDTYATLTLAGTNVNFGRDADNNDAWDPYKRFIDTVTLNVVAERAAATGSISYGIAVSNSSGNLGTLLAPTTGAAAKATYQLDVSDYIDDLTDIRVNIAKFLGSGSQIIKIYGIWFEGEGYTWGVVTKASSTWVPVEQSGTLAGMFVYNEPIGGPNWEAEDKDG